MLHFLIEFFAGMLGAATLAGIKRFVRRDIYQEQVGGKGSVNVQVGGSIKGDVDGEFEFSRCVEHDCTCTHY